MAAADLRDDLRCSICQDIYTNPVTLPCGHNFCQTCIEKTWEAQREMEEDPSCPECRQSYKRTPRLQTNQELWKIAKQFISPATEHDGTGVFCTYCIHSPVPAAKSCLLCEASLCDNHVRVHSKSVEHVLIDPTSSLGNRKCSAHRELLKYFCCEDGSCICESCFLIGEHRGHKVEMLNKASGKKKKKLKKVLVKLTPEREETEKQVQNLLERRREIQGKAASETERVTALFRSIKEWVRSLENRVLSEISRQEENHLLQLTDLIQQLELKKEELSRRIHHIEKLCNMADPLTVLQEPESGGAGSGATEEGDNDNNDNLELEEEEECYEMESEDMKRINKHRKEYDIEELGGLNVDLVASTLLVGLFAMLPEVKGWGVHGEEASDMIHDIISNAKLQFNENTKPKSGTSRSYNPWAKITGYNAPISIKDKLHSLKEKIEKKYLRDPIQTCPPDQIIDLVYGQKVRGMIMDSATASNQVTVGDGKIAAYTRSNQNRPQTPQRFQKYQVLSTRSFALGHHYWEMEVSESGGWRIGVAYPTIEREGDQSYIGNNNKSWCLWGWEDNYSVVHESKDTHLPHKSSCGRIRISLDYEAGYLSFYELSEPIRRLHTFTANFTEPLHAAFSVWQDNACVRIVNWDITT